MKRRAFNNVRIEFPWPSKELSPNARVHWRKKSNSAGEYKLICWFVAIKELRATGAVVRADHDGKYHLTIQFCPPDKRKRDMDNCIGSFKSGQDGLAAAINADDHNFIVTYSMGEPVNDGVVIVEFVNGVRRQSR